MYNFTFGKVTQNSAGEVRIFFGEMKHPVGDMKQNSQGNEAKLMGK